MRNLAAKAWLSVIALAVVMGVLLFGLAGTIRYWQAWVYLAIFFGLTIFTTADLLKRDPALLERRMVGGPTAEQRPVQKIIMWAASAAFVAMLVVPALDYRNDWSRVPLAIVVLGDILVALGFYFIMIVYRANAYAAATIQVEQNQTVISTGPYAIVRHPMYASASLYVIGTPLALGSWWGLVAVAVFIPVLIWRLLDEEHFLTGSLPGYTEYRQKVRYHLIPRIW
ncbi:MAG TPA: isoprenylcysteine carboxylmethyltransferase family protein [Gemmatimonadaceae bacterium]|nr:isoprenylcysteine carboxylmethyltransferase family protein [Gemmatimonadaceae bacterium]